MMDKLEKLDFSMEVKADDISDSGEFKGYLAVFNNVDSHRDIILPGAFTKTLKKRPAKQVKMLWQHDRWEPIGIYTNMFEDKTGLNVQGKLAMGVQQGKEAYELLKMGALSGLSIGYQTIKEIYDHIKRIRNLEEIDLIEGSLVTFPSNARATVRHVKMAQTARELEIYLREVGLSKTEAKYIVAKHDNGSWRDAKSDGYQGVLSSLQECNTEIRQMIGG